MPDFGSCVLKASWACLSINTLNRYPQLTSRSTLNWHPDRYSVNILSTLDQESVDTRLCVNQIIWIHRKLINCQPRCQWSVEQVSNEASMECWSSTCVLIEGQLRLSIEGINRHWIVDAFSTHGPRFQRWSCKYSVCVYSTCKDIVQCVFQLNEGGNR